MNLQTANYRSLYSHEDRTVAHFAARARGDTIMGGASALVLAKRLQRMNPRTDALSVVSNVYSQSTGRWHPDFEAWKCPECDCAHLGKDAALNCCNQDNEEASDL